MLIDIGANLTNKKFDNCLLEILKSSFIEGISYIIITGTTLSNSKKAIDICKKFQNVKEIPILKCTVGIHPHNAKEFNTNTKQQLKTLIENNKDYVVAVGECGFDLNRMFSSIESQTFAFEEQISLALELSMPLFLHEREGHLEFVKLLKKFTLFKPEMAVIHCFTGTCEELDFYIKAGFYIGLTGFITNPKANYLINSISKIPSTKLMIETDSPFMTPNVVYKKINFNEPKYLTKILDELTNILQLDKNRIENCIERNTKKFFKLN